MKKKEHWKRQSKEQQNTIGKEQEQENESRYNQEHFPFLDQGTLNMTAQWDSPQSTIWLPSFSFLNKSAYWSCSVLFHESILGRWREGKQLIYFITFFLLGGGV